MGAAMGGVVVGKKEVRSYVVKVLSVVAGDSELAAALQPKKNKG